MQQELRGYRQVPNGFMRSAVKMATNQVIGWEARNTDTKSSVLRIMVRDGVVSPRVQFVGLCLNCSDLGQLT